MDSLLKHIEENLDDAELQATVSYLNEFHDDDLAMYPAIEIREQDLTAQECETIANNILKAINLADENSVVNPTRALVALAYNSLMDPRRERNRENSIMEKPLLHKEQFKYVEKWFRVCDISDLNLREYLTSDVTIEPGNGDEAEEDDQDEDEDEHEERAEVGEENLPKLKLLRPDAGNFERKASIGAWAYCHLKLMANSKDYLWSRSSTERFSTIIQNMYGFNVAYEFPVLSKSSYCLVGDKLMVNKSGEALYLLYRSMMIMEGSRYSQTREPKWLLGRLVFGHPGGLVQGRLWLWNWAKSASSSKALGVSVERIFNELEWVLSELDHEDSRFVKYTSIPRVNLANLREFHRKYLRAAPVVSRNANSTRSKYFQYARLVNEFYFHSLRLRANRELICAMIYITEKQSNTKVYNRPMRPPWRRWGDEMGTRICQKYSRPARPIVAGDSRTLNCRGPYNGTNQRAAPQPPRRGSGDSGGVKLECPICMTSMASRKQEGHKIIITDCGHMFCADCITGCINNLGRRCPKCRRAMPIREKFIEVFDI